MYLEWAWPQRGAWPENSRVTDQEDRRAQSIMVHEAEKKHGFHRFVSKCSKCDAIVNLVLSQTPSLTNEIPLPVTSVQHLTNSDSH